jgi:hypothetical protein
MAAFNQSTNNLEPGAICHSMTRRRCVPRSESPAGVSANLALGVLVAMPDVAAADAAEPAKAAKAPAAMEVDGPETSSKAIGANMFSFPCGEILPCKLALIR